MEGLKTAQSNFGPQETMDRLEREILAHGMRVFRRINHASMAAEAGLELLPTELIMFGNSRVGTSLMQASQTIGIDLPLKALVWQDAAGKTWLAYNDPAWLTKRHQISEAERTVAAMTRVLGEIAVKATGDRTQRVGNEVKA